MSLLKSVDRTVVKHADVNRSRGGDGAGRFRPRYESESIWTTQPSSVLVAGWNRGGS